MIRKQHITIITEDQHLQDPKTIQGPVYTNWPLEENFNNKIVIINFPTTNMINII